jgi:uncharacterized protein
MENVIFNTENNHSYIYAYHKKEFIFLQPIIKFFLDLEKKSISFNSFINNTKKYRIINGQRYCKDELNYYKNKYNFYKKHLLQNNKSKKIHFNGKYFPTDVQKNLANISEIVFEVTEKCNLDCTYCCYGNLYEKTYQKRNEDLSISSAKEIIDFFFDFWDSTFNNSINDTKTISFYGGEALLRFNFIKNILKYICIKTNHSNKKIKYLITTNGVLLKKHIKFLVENNFTVNVSLDGNDKNNKYRLFHNGDESFKVVLNNLHEIKIKYPKYFSKNLSFQAVLNNTSNIQDIIKYFKDELDVGKDKIDFSILTKEQIKKEKITDFNKIKFNENQKKNISIDSSIKLMTSLSNNCMWDYTEFFNNKSTKNLIPTGSCAPFEKKIFITSRGSILPCERISFNYTLGSVNSNWVNLNAEKIATKVNDYLSNVREICSSCYKNYSCKKCIYNLLAEKSENICSGFCNYSEFSNILGSTFSAIEKKSTVFNMKMLDINYEL